MGARDKFNTSHIVFKFHFRFLLKGKKWWDQGKGWTNALRVFAEGDYRYYSEEDTGAFDRNKYNFIRSSNTVYLHAFGLSWCLVKDTFQYDD
ncbi:hypothetical protein AVEN_147277-1 [Araneus ventricosus]|uniref:Uncharacterized protein n=1 Tax=Araneus ventricosus TaxID=182803 RepID=A0A4Y2L8A4_ARAVE|nr:hypothetical protein AVEN_147277-1 [Araneus ventricosus]